MPVSPASAQAPSQGAKHDRGYHPLRIASVTEETDDARSYGLEVPAELAGTYAYEAGQFLTFRAHIDGQVLHRSYSMSSTPGVDDQLAVTVKRVPGGAVSNWMIDSLRVGDTVEANAPAGVFRLRPNDRPVLGFAAGSGVTPIFSITKAALASSDRPVQLLYANRDRESVIFAAELDALATRHGARLLTAHHLDCDEGFVTAEDIEPFLAAARGADCYVCGPAAFMDVIEAALLDGGVPAEQIHIERFTVPEPIPADAVAAAAADDPPAAAGTEAAQITIELDGVVKTATHHAGATILQTARQLGFSPPFSCEAGNCATCMAKCVEGEVRMFVNDALFDDEVADGWILTCQSVPTTPVVSVVYGYDEGS